MARIFYSAWGFRYGKEPTSLERGWMSDLTAATCSALAVPSGVRNIAFVEVGHQHPLLYNLSNDAARELVEMTDRRLRHRFRFPRTVLLFAPRSTCETRH